jgi:ABC-type phosphate transport system substrate-binding protein
MKTGLGILLFAATLIGGILVAQAREIAVVVNEKAPVSAITASELKDIYLGEKTFWDSVKIKPIDQEGGSSIRAGFLTGVLKTTAESYDSYWTKKLFQDGGVSPSKKKSSGEVLDAVAQDVGTIGYVYKDEISGKAGVKVVFTSK